MTDRRTFIQQSTVLASSLAIASTAAAKEPKAVEKLRQILTKTN